MKHAFLMMAHKQPELIERIIERLEAPNHYIYIHYDLKGTDFDKIEAICKTHQNMFLLERKNVRWGMFSQTLCEIEGFRAMILSDNHYDYYHLISGQDYPCVKIETFDSFFEDNNGKSFMKLDSDEETVEYRKNKFPYRLEKWYLNDKLDVSLCGVKLYKLANRLSKIIPRPYSTMDSIWGWNWFSVTYNVLEYCMNYLNVHTEYLKRFKHTLASDELIFSTIIKPVASELNVELNNALRFVEWHPKRETKALPLLLNENEFDDVMNSGAFFCRKVQLPESEKLMDMIDKKVEIDKTTKRRSKTL